MTGQCFSENSRGSNHSDPKIFNLQWSQKIKNTKFCTSMGGADSTSGGGKLIPEQIKKNIYIYNKL